MAPPKNKPPLRVRITDVILRACMKLRILKPSTKQKGSE